MSDSEKTKVQLRVQLRGYSSNRHRLQEIVKDALSGYKYYKNQEPDLSQVNVAEKDSDLVEIVERVSKSIEKLEWPKGDRQPNKDQMLLEALKVIYGD